MELEKKMKIYAVITFLGLVLMVVAYVSPGWGVLEIVQEKQWQGTLIDDMPIAMEKREAESRHKRHHHHHHHHHKDRNTLRVHMGLWYYVLCARNCDKNMPPKDFVLEKEQRIDDMDEPQLMATDQREGDYDKGRRHHGCKARTYFHDADLPSMYYSMSSQFDTIREIGKRGMCEFRVMTSVGLTMGVIGFIFSLIYKRRLAQTRRSGLAAFICLLTAAVLYLVSVGKIVSATHQYKAMFPDSFQESSGVHLHMHCPWSLILAGVSAMFVLVSATGHLCILTRDRTDYESRIYRIHSGTKQGVPSKFSFATIAPPGYDASVGLKVPLTSAMETCPDNAEPLPVKESI